MKALIIASLVLVSFNSMAESVMTTTKPTSIPMSQVLKSKGVVSKCEHKKMGETGRLKNVLGSKAFFTSELPKAEDTAGDALADGKAVYICKTVEFDRTSGKFTASN